MKEIKLLFDLEATQPIGNMKRHGGGKYAESIFFRLIEKQIPFSCFYNSCKWINPIIVEAIERNKIPLFDNSIMRVDEIVKENGITRIYSALPRSIASLTCCEVVGTIHDLRFLELPFDSHYYRYNNSSSFELFKERLRFFVKSCFPNYAQKKLIKSYLNNYFNTSMRIITDSYHSKYSMLSYIPNTNDKDIRVFYAPNTSMKKQAPTSVCKEKYLLSVSGCVWSKNILRSIIAFDRLVSKGLIRDYKYKITGASASNFKYEFENPSCFDFLGYVDDLELEQLYANANIFVYPSLSEGFGYPPLEAMRYKVPVIASPFTSIYEILGQGALYFNPLNVEEIMNRMLMLILDNELYKDISQRGFNQYLAIKKKQDEDLDLLIDYITKES